MKDIHKRERVKISLRNGEKRKKMEKKKTEGREAIKGKDRIGIEVVLLYRAMRRLRD